MQDRYTGTLEDYHALRSSKIRKRHSEQFESARAEERYVCVYNVKVILKQEDPAIMSRPKARGFYGFRPLSALASGFHLACTLRLGGKHALWCRVALGGPQQQS